MIYYLFELKVVTAAMEEVMAMAHHSGKIIVFLLITL